jgi:hypothetical protein
MQIFILAIWRSTLFIPILPLILGLKYVVARRNSREVVRHAKSTWIKDKCDSINTGVNSSVGGKDAWDLVKILKTCLAPTRRSPPNKMRREDGSIDVTHAKGAEVFAHHFNQLYGCIPNFDPSILDILPQQPSFPSIKG